MLDNFLKIKISIINKSIKDKRILNFIEIIQIMEWKEKKNNNEKFFDNKIISHKKLSLFLSKEFNKNISEQMIKYYWNGTVKLIEKEFIEYYKNNYLQEYNKYINLLKL